MFHYLKIYYTYLASTAIGIKLSKISKNNFYIFMLLLKKRLFKKLSIVYTQYRFCV